MSRYDKRDRVRRLWCSQIFQENLTVLRHYMYQQHYVLMTWQHHTQVHHFRPFPSNYKLKKLPAKNLKPGSFVFYISRHSTKESSGILHFHQKIMLSCETCKRKYLSVVIKKADQLWTTVMMKMTATCLLEFRIVEDYPHKKTLPVSEHSFPPPKHNGRTQITRWNIRERWHGFCV
jgi:hypothetical protein